MARRTRLTAAAAAMTLLLTAQTSTIEDLPISAITAGGPPMQVWVVQEPTTDDSTDLTGLLTAAGALVAGVAALVGTIQKARNNAD